jgi:hypothetical protein
VAILDRHILEFFPEVVNLPTELIVDGPLLLQLLVVLEVTVGDVAVLVLL